MAPLSKSDVGCEREKSAKYDEDVSKISEQLGKIDIDKVTEDESTYIINDENDEDDLTATTTNTDNNTNILDDCTTIQEKGADRKKLNENRTQPYPVKEPGNLQYNCNNLGGHTPQNIFDPYSELVSFNIPNNQLNTDYFLNGIPLEDLGRLISTYPENNNYNSDYNLDQNVYNPCSIVSDSSSDYNYTPPLLCNNENIPATIELYNFPETTSHVAEKALSDEIDKDKPLKQTVWIQVNIEKEENLIEKLRNRIASLRFNQIVLNYIYATIIRLMKDVEGKRLLLNYFLNDENILFNVAIKKDVLLMNFILEVQQNLGINPNRYNILFQIIDNSHIDLCDILECLLNNKSGLNIFDVNCLNDAKETPLMVLLKNMSENKGSHVVNTKYFDLILSRNPDVNYVTDDGRGVLNFAMDIRCRENILRRIGLYNDPLLNINLLDQEYQNEWIPPNFYTNY